MRQTDAREEPALTLVIDARFLAGLGVLVLLTISPGADMALVAKVTIARGRAAALVASLGICTGLFVHATASALGLSVVLATSSEAFTIVKLAGAAYLAYLGVRSVRDSFRPAPDVGVTPVRARSSFAQGLLSNVLNPKVAVFYLTFLPQFIDPAGNVLAQSLLFAVAHSVMGIVWLAAYAYVLDRMSAFFARSGVRRWLERVTGAVLIGLGVRLAFERR
ncbi:MAG TPA: LysE family translocator [Candidatus Limnocylindrales bacterium]|nr:LysE family translocator [Candidatus Limnocylindrales bacterium]